MNSRLSRLLVLCAVLLLALSPAACGNKGDLVRPGKDAPAGQ